MKYLWSPWRMNYIKNHNKEADCVFCGAQAEADGDGNLIAFRGTNAYVILNRYPYTSGHLMVIPFQHVPTLEELDVETRAEMMELTTRCMTILRKLYRPHGFNMACWDMCTSTLCRAGQETRTSCHPSARRASCPRRWRRRIKESKRLLGISF